MKRRLIGLSGGWKTRTLVLATIVASMWSLTSALGYYSYVRSPLQFNTTVTSTWSHAAGYGERALDLNATGNAVYSYLENPHATDYLYYEIYNYKVNSTDCPGSKFLLYDHTPGGQYYYYGRINYVHLTDHEGKWGRSWNINPGASESDLYIGYTVASCGVAAHLHVGHMNGDGMREEIAGYSGQAVNQGNLLMYH